MEGKVNRKTRNRSGDCRVKDKKQHLTTTFQISHHLHTELKVMCVLTGKTMGEFIRIAVLDKINQLRNQQVK